MRDSITGRRIGISTKMKVGLLIILVVVALGTGYVSVSGVFSSQSASSSISLTGVNITRTGSFAIYLQAGYALLDKNPQPGGQARLTLWMILSSPDDDNILPENISHMQVKISASGTDFQVARVDSPIIGIQPSNVVDLSPNVERDLVVYVTVPNVSYSGPLRLALSAQAFLSP